MSDGALWSLHRYELLFAPQPPAASCQYLSGVERTLQRHVADANDHVMHQAERLKAEGTTAAACEEQLQEIEHCTTVFLRENGEQGSLSLAGIITSALCTLCRFYMFHCSFHFSSFFKWLVVKCTCKSMNRSMNKHIEYTLPAVQEGPSGSRLDFRASGGIRQEMPVFPPTGETW